MKNAKTRLQAAKKVVHKMLPKIMLLNQGKQSDARLKKKIRRVR